MCNFIGWFMLASDTQVPNGTVENTLAKMKEGEFVSRPGWEDVYTSMAKPKSDSKATPVSFVHLSKVRLYLLLCAISNFCIC